MFPVKDLHLPHFRLPRQRAAGEELSSEASLLALELAEAEAGKGKLGQRIGQTSVLSVLQTMLYTRNIQQVKPGGS